MLPGDEGIKDEGNPGSIGKNGEKGRKEVVAAPCCQTAHNAYLVPYVENEDEVFLKTIIPSRKATGRFFGEEHED
jgi:hypothetical protein